MAFPVLIALGLLALSMAATYYLRPDTSAEKLRAASLSDFGAPRAVDGDALPLVYGTMRLRSPALVWFGDLAATPITVDGGVLAEDQLVGYRYDVSMRLILCRGNTPVSEAGQFAGARFNALYIGDKKVRFLSTTEATYGFTAQIHDDDAPGGDFQGYLYFYRGRWDQQLMGGFGVYAVDRGTTPEEAADTTPPYRGQVMLSLRQWYCAQPSLPLISVVVTNPITIPGYETETAPIGADQANPAAVIYDLLTNAWGGVGSSTSDIDLASFAAVAETLRDEQHGISIALARTTDARQVIEDVLRQIDGVLYQEPTTRKYVLRLIREDYTLGSLPILDESNIIGPPKLTSSMWSETVNEVRVIWTNPDRDYADATAAAQDLANVNAQGGRRRSSEFRYPGVQNFALAAYLATRDLNFLSRPIMKLELSVNRTGVTLRPGDAFRFQWSAWGIDAVFRVMEPKFGSLTDGAVTFAAVQDRFSVAGTLHTPPDAVNDDFGGAAYPTPILLRTITEAPRWIQLKAFEA
ncbi:MAG: phage tail protein, partial [Alphaproteobacteria bacterium]